MIVFPTRASGASQPQFHHKMTSLNKTLNYTCQYCCNNNTIQ